MKNEIFCFFPVNAATIHCQFIVIVNALDNENMTGILFFDSSARKFDPRKPYHISMATENATYMLESDFCTIF